MENTKKSLNTPQAGFKGFIQNWKQDAFSGFLVSLIALPLSLGIAGASGFPPIMGVLTAIIGGLAVSFFSGSALTIKGPAAGLIVIVAGAVEALGQGDAVLGWKLTLGIVIIAGCIQILFGLLKVASLANFFPLSAVHGMLAAIGIIILSKQIHFALGIDPVLLKGKEPMELLMMIPESLAQLNPFITAIGLISVLILFTRPLIKNKIVKSIPAPLVILVLGIVLGQYFQLSRPEFSQLKPLVNPGNLSLQVPVDFSALWNHQSYIFFQYLFLFTIIGSVESLLTAKAIDLLDPWKRKARLNLDLLGVGIGNVLSGLLGGLPMISEVARSSANINNGGRTQWANAFHGLFLLIFVVILIPVIKLVPMATLAAMLIFIGVRLASLKTFMLCLKVGKEQLLVFTTTIIVILFTDLLIGILAGIILELFINFYLGQKLSTLFSPHFTFSKKYENQYLISLKGAYTFSNWIRFEKKINQLHNATLLELDVKEVHLIDHSFMENLEHLKDEKSAEGCEIQFSGLEEMKRMGISSSSACIR